MIFWVLYSNPFSRRFWNMGSAESYTWVPVSQPKPSMKTPNSSKGAGEGRPYFLPSSRSSFPAPGAM